MGRAGVVDGGADNSEFFAGMKKLSTVRVASWDYQFTWMDYHQWKPYIDK